jgi:hypothetical protein
MTPDFQNSLFPQYMAHATLYGTKYAIKAYWLSAFYWDASFKINNV